VGGGGVDKKFVRGIFEIRQRKWQDGVGTCMIKSFVTSALPNNKMKEKEIDAECTRQWKEQIHKPAKYLSPKMNNLIPIKCGYFLDYPRDASASRRYRQDFYMAHRC
jgi:hypothetical protein